MTCRCSKHFCYKCGGVFGDCECRRIERERWQRERELARQRRVIIARKIAAAKKVVAVKKKRDALN